MKKINTIVIALALAATTLAQAPQKMSYQAVIRNASNNLVTTATVGMRISVLQGSSTGTAVYVETQTPATNANGLATLSIGGGTVTTGTFSAINWATGTYFLKTETDPTGGTSYSITGTSQLMSVPYAMYSASTGDTSMWKKNTNNIYYNSGGVGIGTKTPQNYLHILDTITNGGIYEIIESRGGSGIQLWTHDTLNAPMKRWVLTNGDDAANGNSFSIENYNGIGWFLHVFTIKSGSPVNSLVLTPSGVGIRTSTAPSKLTVTGGDVNITDIASGVVMKSPNGQCYRTTVNNSGVL